MDYPRIIAGVGASVGACLLIWKGETALGATILSGMLAFFVGEHNGKRSGA